MKIHSEFKALAPRGRWAETALNQETVSDGGFARVVVLSDAAVLKASSCPATNRLLQKLWQLSEAGTPVPANLPCVFKRHGLLVADKEGIPFEVWELERLFEPQDVTKQRLARVVGRTKTAGYKPMYRRQVARLTADYSSELREALRFEQTQLGDDASWQAHESVALTMALRTEGSLRDTFLFLQKFIRETRSSLDLLGRGNILVNMFGEPCLCDPVCESLENTATRHIAERAPQVCLAAEVPVSVKGFQVKLEPRATLPLSAEELTPLLARFTSMGLAPSVLPWSSTELRAFVQSKERMATVWDYPDAAKRVSQGTYAALFCQA